MKQTGNSDSEEDNNVNGETVSMRPGPRNGFTTSKSMNKYMSGLGYGNENNLGKQKYKPSYTTSQMDKIVD